MASPRWWAAAQPPSTSPARGWSQARAHRPVTSRETWSTGALLASLRAGSFGRRRRRSSRALRWARGCSSRSPPPAPWPSRVATSPRLSPRCGPLAVQVLAQRQAALDAAYAAHPERFVRGRPVVPSLPDKVWINKPSEGPAATDGALQSICHLGVSKLLTGSGSRVTTTPQTFDCRDRSCGTAPFVLSSSPPLDPRANGR